MIIQIDQVNIILVILNNAQVKKVKFNQMIMQMKMMTGVAKCAMCMRVGGSLLSYEARKG